MRWTSFCLGSLLALTVAFSVQAFEWDVIELGSETSAQGPYQGGEVIWDGIKGFTITATGGDIWSGELGCTYAYMKEPVSGDFVLQYTIEEHTTNPPTTWSKCGALVIQDLDPFAPYVFLQSTPSNDPVAVNDKGTKLISRPEWKGDAGPGSNGWTPLQWPVTYKLVREGDMVIASVSFDGGKTFQSIEDPADNKSDRVKIDYLQDPVYVGIAINGHNNGQTTGTARVVDILFNGTNALAVEPAGKLADLWGRWKVNLP